MSEEKELNAQLSALETGGDGSKLSEETKEIASTRLAEVHQKLADIDAETGPVSRDWNGLPDQQWAYPRTA